VPRLGTVRKAVTQEMAILSEKLVACSNAKFQFSFGMLLFLTRQIITDQKMTKK
jgi:hypothetical protein